MSTSVGKKAKKKWKSIPLDKALPNTLVRSTTSWADEVEDELSEYTLNKISNISLPTAPQASCDLYVDESRIPPNGPFMAYLSNLSFEVVEDDIIQHFKELKISDVKLPRDSRHDRMMGYGYVTFAEKAGLMSALGQGEVTMKGRPVRISLPNDDDKEKERGNRSGRMFGNRDRDNFMDRTDSTDGGSTEWRVGKPQSSQEPERSSGAYQPRSGRREFNASSFGQRERDFERQGGGFGKNRDGGSDRNRFQNRDRDSNDRRGMGFGRRGFDSDVQFRREQMPERPPQVVTEVKTRTKIQVLPRTVVTEAAPVVPSSAIFGGAKPVDTAARERQIEEKMLRESTTPLSVSRPSTLISRSSSQSSLRSNNSRRDEGYGREVDVETDKDLDEGIRYEKDEEGDSYLERNQDEVISMQREEIVFVKKDEPSAYQNKPVEEKPPSNIWAQRSAARVGLQQLSYDNGSDSQVVKEAVTAVSKEDGPLILTKEVEKIAIVQSSSEVLPVKVERVQFKEPLPRPQVVKAEVKHPVAPLSTPVQEEVKIDTNKENPWERRMKEQQQKDAQRQEAMLINKVDDTSVNEEPEYNVTKESEEGSKRDHGGGYRTRQYSNSDDASYGGDKLHSERQQYSNNSWDRRMKEKQETDATSNNKTEDSSEQSDHVAKEELEEGSKRDHGYRTRHYSNSDNASHGGDRRQVEYSDRRQYNDRNHQRGGGRGGFRGRGFGNKGFYNKFHSRENVRDINDAKDVADDNGGQRSDTRDGGQGYDTRDGGQRNDTRDGGQRNDTRDGGQRNNTRDGGQRNDTRDGGQRGDREYYNRGNRDGYRNKDRGGYGYRENRGGYNNDRGWKRDGNRNEDNRERRDRRPNENRETENYDGFERRPPRNQDYNHDGEKNYRGRDDDYRKSRGGPRGRFPRRERGNNNFRGSSDRIEYSARRLNPHGSQSELGDNDDGKSDAVEPRKEIDVPVVEEMPGKEELHPEKDDSKTENVGEQDIGKNEDGPKENSAGQSTTKRKKKKKSNANKELNADNLPQNNNENQEQKNKPKNEKPSKEKSNNESKDKSKRIKDTSQEVVIAPRYQRTKNDAPPAIKRTNRYEFLQDADSIL